MMPGGKSPASRELLPAAASGTGFRASLTRSPDRIPPRQRGRQGLAAPDGERRALHVTGRETRGGELVVDERLHRVEFRGAAGEPRGSAGIDRPEDAGERQVGSREGTVELDGVLQLFERFARGRRGQPHGEARDGEVGVCREGRLCRLTRARTHVVELLAPLERRHHVKRFCQAGRSLDQAGILGRRRVEQLDGTVGVVDRQRFAGLEVLVVRRRIHEAQRRAAVLRRRLSGQPQERGDFARDVCLE